MKKRWSTWVEKMVPPGLDEESEFRARFFVRGWAVAIAVALTMVIGYALSEVWSQVLNIGLLVVVGPVVLHLHRRGIRFTLLVHASLFTTALVFGLGTIAQRPADFTSLAQMLLIPLLGCFLLGARPALRWFFASAFWSVVIIFLAKEGWVFDYVDPAPQVSFTVNIVIGLLLSYLFASAFDNVRAQTMERLRELNRARSSFLANISHEIRTPMNGVLGMTEVLLLDELKPEHREQLQIIQRSGHTLVALVNDVLDISKMEAGKLELEYRDFDLDTVLSDVHALSQANARKRGLRLSVCKADGVPLRLRGDGPRLGQVLSNLVSNAVKFTLVGEVRVEVERRPSLRGVLCGFAVTDTGIGIPSGVLPRLFQAFQQADASTTRRYGGTGLGLALSQQLVTLMGGSIAVSSKSGEGSRFSFEILFEEPHETLSPAPPQPLASSVLSRAVLVADDNDVNLLVATRLVERAGFIVTGVATGKAALEEVQRGDYAMVLMDCHMPEMDGFEATERIRALSGAVGRIPIIAVTASAMPEELAACRRVGMNAVLAKPLTFTALLEVLTRQTK